MVETSEGFKLKANEVHIYDGAGRHWPSLQEVLHKMLMAEQESFGSLPLQKAVWNTTP